MSSIDTHRIVKRLKDAGFTDVRAETVADVVREARELEFSHLATKADLQTSISELRGEMAELIPGGKAAFLPDAARLN